MNISLLVALTTQGVIGKDNALPWSLPEDLKRFKRLTMGHPMIMGRKTFDSIGRALPGRRNLVISRNQNLHVDGVEFFLSLDQALSSCKEAKEIFIIGGAQIFTEALSLANKLYLTWIEQPFPGDVYFPKMESFLEDFEKISSQREALPFPYEFADYLRKK